MGGNVFRAQEMQFVPEYFLPIAALHFFFRYLFLLLAISRVMLYLTNQKAVYSTYAHL